MSLAWRNEGQPLGPSGHGHPGSDLSGRPRGGCLADCGIRVCRAATDRREPPVSAEGRRRGRDRGRARRLPPPAESRGGGPVRDGAGPGRAVSLRARPAHGAVILAEPADYMYGERQYGAEDFAGHRWTFTETLSDTDPQTWGGQYLNPD